jgi:hypothetical protein
LIIGIDCGHLPADGSAEAITIAGVIREAAVSSAFAA